MQAAVPESPYRSEVGPDGVSTLRHYLRALWRRKWIGLVPVVVLPLVTLVGSLDQSPQYAVTADVLIDRQDAVVTSLIGQTPALDDVGRTMDTQSVIAREPALVERALAAAGVPRSATKQFLTKSGAFPVSNVLRFSVTDPDRARAARLASAYAREFVRYRRELDTAGLARTLADLRSRITRLEAAGQVGAPLYARLTEREQQLESLRALRTSNVSLVQLARGRDALELAPRPRRDIALSLVAGLVIGLVLVFLAESLSTRPRSEEEMEALLGMPFCGRLGPAARRAGGSSPPLLGDPGGPGADAVHTVRANLELANAAVGARTIMVTSLHAGEGVSAAAANLAVALARSGRHVAIVDLDLREPSLAALFGLDDRLGVTTLARGECEVSEALLPIPLTHADGSGSTAPASNGSGAVGALLEVVTAGPRSAHPTELLSSGALAAALAHMRQRAEIVLVVLPALLDVPDAALVSPRVDGLLLVLDPRRARRPELAEARRTLAAWPPAKLGFALTEGGGDATHPRLLRRAGPPARTGLAEPGRVA